MKFVVDELPYWQDDCPFLNYCCGTCKLDDELCNYMNDYIAGARPPESCRWLKEEGD